MGHLTGQEGKPNLPRSSVQQLLWTVLSTTHLSEGTPYTQAFDLAHVTMAEPLQELTA